MGCAYDNGFVLAERLYVVMLRDCAVSGNVSFWGGVHISLVSLSHILYLEISILEYENNKTFRFQVSWRHDTVQGC